MAGGRRRKSLLSKLYAVVKSSSQDDHAQVGGPGFSHMVFVNEPNCFEATNLNYVPNHISTTKYTVVNFIPKSLYEQFRRVANCYFLFAGILSFTPLAPFAAISAILPLIVVISATMFKESREDIQRMQQDNEVNNRKVGVHQGNGTFSETEWKSLKVGDIVKVKKDSFFPADLLLLSSSYEDAICYVETMNLDGETNLKMKQALEVTSGWQDDSSFQDFKGLIKCEDPNANLYSFIGKLDYEERQYPLSPQQILLRDSKLRNTEYVYGAVIFTGPDTKVMQNSTAPPSKRSTIEKKMDKLVYALLAFLGTIATIGSIVFGVNTKDGYKNDKLKDWYLRPDDTTTYFDPNNASTAAFLHFLTAMILYAYFIPISLYISIEVAKVIQSSFINQDINMYYEPADKPARARTSNLVEELGQVDTILTDKTGTLTCNSMEFIKCTIAGIAYGRGITEVERALARRNGELEDEEESAPVDTAPSVKGFNFKDERIMNGNWVAQPQSGTIQLFLQLLAVCHTAIPEVDEDSRKVSYEAESPDEAAFVVAARELGFEFYQRTQNSLFVHELDPSSGMTVEREYELLHIIEFNSTRKRMSVVVRNEDGKILLFCKGADSIMLERLGKNGRSFEEETIKNINEYADAGLRTLVLAYRQLGQEEYDHFNRRYTEAKNSISADRDEKIAAAAEMMEKDLILLGATAVEDKLQTGVPQCIDKLAQAGIKIWVLTGDKMETAINIGFACSLLRQGMKQIVITLDSPEIEALEKEGNKEGIKEAIAKASKNFVIRQLNDGQKLMNSARNDVYALIIDGKSLTYALEEDVKAKFLSLATGCASVICCRSSPKQKALVTKLVKEGSGKTTLGIGDGANDVGMIQEADIGIGISGFEGMQAVMASDVAIAQFRYLERLLLVHGHWSYRRISSMICYFFYKNFTFGITIFLYEAYTMFSGQPAYNDWFMSLYNVFFTSFAVVALGVFDQDVSAKDCLKFPLLYQEGIQNLLFSWTRVFGWIFNAVLNAITIFYFCTSALQDQAFRKGGETAGRDILGLVMYTCVVMVVNIQMGIFVKYFTLVQHIATWGGIVLWYLFMLIYGSIPPQKSTNAFMVFVEAVGPAASCWLITIFVVVATLIPYFTFSVISMRFFPMFHEMIQWQKVEGEKNDPEFCNMVRTRSVRQDAVGFSARRESLRL